MGLSKCVYYIEYKYHYGDMCGSSFVYVKYFCYYINCLYNHKYKFISEKEQVNESQYIVSRPDSVRIRHSGRIGNGGVTIALESCPTDHFG